MPERFALESRTENGEWITEAVCLASRFERPGEGSYICSEFSSGLWIRCIAKHADHFEHVDRDGAAYRYLLVPLLAAPDD